MLSVAWLAVPYFSALSHKQHAFREKGFETCVLIFSTTSVQNISHSTKNWARRHKFYVLLTVHPGMTLGKWPTWCTIMLSNTFYYYYYYYYYPVHVSSNTVPIIRRSNCINTASGIVFSISDRSVSRLRSNYVPSQPAHPMVTYREYYTRCCINTIWPPDDEHWVARNM